MKTTTIGPVRAEVTRAAGGHYLFARLLEGPDAGSLWALAGSYPPGTVLRVRYSPADQFITVAPEG